MIQRTDYPRAIRRVVRRFFLRDDALAITEYAMLIAFIAIIVVAVLSVFGSQIGTWFSSRTGNITTV